MKSFITLNESNIANEHICCAISDKKCEEGTRLKKEWLKKQFENGYVFRRIDDRAKVFMEYGPAEYAWSPVHAPNYLFINCFWVSGQYKGKGYAKSLLENAIDDAKKQKKNGLVTVAGIKKFHFMSDSKWFLKQGFESVDTTPSGFCLLVYKLDPNAETPSFNECAKKEKYNKDQGLVAYYSNRCPFTELHVNHSLVESTKNRNLDVKIVKLDSLEKAQLCPSPGTVFSLFYNGKFVTTDVSCCMDSRFDKIVKLS
ncbi:MAG: GNAT family N-acetyltransferase [Flavobacteriaceae bacterium]|jgi:predicted GNAT family acetyltransferase|nr:GNAT family N-acetyltransferase [Flavobacteriaceae bacterium]